MPPCAPLRRLGVRGATGSAGLPEIWPRAPFQSDTRLTPAPLLIFRRHLASRTVHTAAVLKGTRSFLTDITAHRLRLPCRRDAPTSCQIKIIRRDHPINASQYRGHATSCLWCKGDRLAKRCGAVGRSRLRNVGSFLTTPFTSVNTHRKEADFSRARVVSRHFSARARIGCCGAAWESVLMPYRAR